MAHGQQGMKMRLHILRGSFAADDEAGRLGQCPMDPEVWGKLPEDVIWRVLHFVPVAKQFQLQSVSPEWRQKLTSDHFRLAAAAARASSRQDSESEEQQQRVVACVSRQAPGGGASSSGSSKLWKVVEIDLSFVPRELWSPTSEPYSVKAAANGLVIISVVEQQQGWVQSGKPLTCRYCVLNPLTRTCIELPAPRFDPPLHWMPPTPAAVSVYGYIDAERPRYPHDKSLMRATYKLAGSGAGAGDWVVSTFSDRDASRLRLRIPAGPAAMAGETAWTDILRRWSPVLAERSATPIGKLWCPPCVWARPMQPPGEAAVPSVRSLQVDRTQAFVVVAADKGVVVLVAGLALQLGRFTRFYEPGTAFGLWQMPRDRADWVPEAVTELNMAVVMRLVPGLTCRQVDHDLLDVLGVYAVRELVCCRMEIFRFEDARRWQGKWVPFTLGFNLDTGEWQLVQGDEPRRRRKRGRGCDDAGLGLDDSSYSAACAMTVRDACMPFELRPDLFLKNF